MGSIMIEDKRLEELAKWSRKIAQIAPCISTHQAGSECNGVKFIEMHQMYGSKVGMQGAVDAVVTLGKELNGQDQQYERGIYFPKNKLPGDKDRDKDLKNAKWSVTIDPDRCQFKGTLT